MSDRPTETDAADSVEAAPRVVPPPPPLAGDGVGTSGPEAVDGVRPQPSRSRRRRRLLEWVVLIVVALLVATGLRTFVFQAFYVPSGSMLPTLQIGDRIVVIKFGYTIHRGDIVVFRRPPADYDTQDADLVKRVIGLPGETISSVGATVLINGKPLAEPWLPPLVGQCSELSEHIPTTVIPPDSYFVMGDCRGDSEDSRYWGTLPASLIVGKVEFIVWRDGRPYFHFF